MSLKKLKTNLAANIAEAIDVLEALEAKGDKFVNKAADKIEDVAKDIDYEVHQYEKPVDNVLTVAVDSPHTAWLVIVALALAIGAGAFLHSLFC